MREADFDAFSEILDDVWTLKGQALTPGAKATWFRALSGLSLQAVRAGFDAHIRDAERGRFLPMPADVLAQVERAHADDGRPGAEEAWAIAVRAQDEASTVVWTDEIAQAFGIARPILDCGDEVGARMAFREAYTRLLGEARANRRAPAWSATLGYDPEQRERVMAAAAQLGRIPADEVLSLPAPRAPVALLEGPGSEIPEEARRALLALREWLTGVRDTPPSADATARAETQRLKEEAGRKFAGVPVPTTEPVTHWQDIE